jgi:replicative DNA helicase
MAQEKGTDRLPPQNLDAERSVLGSLLRDNEVINDVVPLLHLDHFYSDAHRKIYEAIRHLYDAAQKVDTVLLAEELNRRGQIDDIGSYGYLAELWDAAPTAANAVHYAKIVRDKAVLRYLIHTSTEVLRDAYDQSQPAEELVQTAERKIFQLSDLGAAGEAMTLSDALKLAYDRIDDRSTGEQLTVSGLATGFTELDELTAGLQHGALTVIAARPSVGKTAFALALVRNIAVDGGHPVFFASLEQSHIELAERLLCCQSQVESHKLRKGNLGSGDMAKLIAAGGVLRNAPVFIDDTASQNISRIAANSRRLLHRHKIKAVVIDYLQLIDPENRRDSRQEQVALISRRLKHMARELKIPIVALAQLNRSTEERKGGVPRLADLRESGSIEADADTVMLLHRPEMYRSDDDDGPPQGETGKLEVIVAKQRNGPTGDIALRFVKQFFRFENWVIDSHFSV